MFGYKIDFEQLSFIIIIFTVFHLKVKLSI